MMIRVPRDLQEEILEVDHVTDELAAELRRTPTPAEIDKRTRFGKGAASRVAAAKADRIPSSLDSTLDDGQTAIERFGSENAQFGAIEDSDEMREAMAGLGPVENQIRRLRFVDDMTQSEVAERIGCWQMHVSRVLRRTIENILQHIETD